ncbi:hypothetical protein PCYB_006310 [Plasmodium cynomolgi strain B]|uniref:Uncharacterized protein n=1 Tax=Plasmodium cynomolgi (strain B) TaxID=1120755 RepID=K6VKB1_PLACD|nr:hypothetical protein PCYB_006310 [Plasmodium cynomolgi strain B]GAB69882.1 hypothetical protein PCYB_006310 [Plasmodium cynomolgi strain B]
MILFLLYECAIRHNQLNATQWKKKKRKLYEHMRKDFLQISLVKDIYHLRAHVKNKINLMNFFGIIFSDSNDGSLGNGDSRQHVGGAILNGKGETWGKQILLYNEAKIIDLLKKNEIDKSILSEAFTPMTKIFCTSF